MTTAKRLRQLLDYDPDAGVFTRRSNTGGRRAGDSAGGLNLRGYISLSVDGHHILAHRAAFLWMTGEIPDREVDHINGLRTDNRWSNLRIATSAQNKINRSTVRTRHSGLPRGVHPANQLGNKFVASVSVGDKSKHLGTFDTIEQARAAYCVAVATIHGNFLPEEN